MGLVSGHYLSTYTWSEQYFRRRASDLPPVLRSNSHVRKQYEPVMTAVSYIYTYQHYPTRGASCKRA